MSYTPTHLISTLWHSGANALPRCRECVQACELRRAMPPPTPPSSYYLLQLVWTSASASAVVVALLLLWPCGAGGSLFAALEEVLRVEWEQTEGPPTAARDLADGASQLRGALCQELQPLSAPTCAQHSRVSSWYDRPTRPTVQGQVPRPAYRGELRHRGGSGVGGVLMCRYDRCLLCCGWVLWGAGTSVETQAGQA